MIADWMAAVLVLAGVALMVVAGIGLLRLPDVLCRGHAIAKAVSLGIALILLGTWVRLAGEGVGVKLALAIVFQLSTIPVASHLISRAAYRSGTPLWRERPVDRCVVPSQRTSQKP
jgi:multicomponent Na+:H+ antiporter subunit G